MDNGDIVNNRRNRVPVVRIAPSSYLGNSCSATKASGVGTDFWTANLEHSIFAFWVVLALVEAPLRGLSAATKKPRRDDCGGAVQGGPAIRLLPDTEPSLLHTAQP